MSLCLGAWLEETCATQLLLGHHWLKQRWESKEAGVKLEKDAAWISLYHDNGSCLDITNDTDPAQNSYLHVIQLAPLVLCDNRFHIRASFSPQCIAQLRSLHIDWPLSRQRLHTTIAVRRYTIRCTSYGPKSDRLQLVLHALDWIPRGTFRLEGFNPRQLKSLLSDEIEDILQRFQVLREKRDRKCLATQVAPLNDHDHDKGTDMAGRNDACEGESQPLTQLAFGTQISHGIRPSPRPQKTSNTEDARKESLLAGQLQGEKPQMDAQALLGLLRRQKAPSGPATVEGSSRDAHSANLAKRLDAPTPATEQPSTQLQTVLDRQPTQCPAKPGSSSPKLNTPHQETRKKKLEPPIRSQVERPTTERESPRDGARVGSNYIQELASQCSWMRDFEFTRETFKVNNRQLSLLQKDESWHKPHPGKTFPQGNIPIEILNLIHRIADESAASGAAPDSDDVMDEDPTPESNLESVDPSPAFPPEIQQTVGSPSSQVSWSSSPEPPMLPQLVKHDLPPDSSFEVHKNRDIEGAPQAQITHESARRVSQAVNAEPDNSISSSPPPMPALDSDDDMEMEAQIPQALGEDLNDSSAKSVVSLPISASPHVTSVVQVRETPYVKSKSAQMPLPSTSSTSIIYATYGDTEPRVHSSNQKQLAVATSNTVAAQQAPINEKEDSVEPSPRPISPIQFLTNHAITIPSPTPHSTSPETSPVDQQFVNEMATSEDLATRPHSKRKHENSPSKKAGPHTKTRKIKYKGFTMEGPTRLNLTPDLGQSREKSFERFREQRRSSASSVNEAKNVTEQKDEDVVMIDLPETDDQERPTCDMSPRHRSLYNEPVQKSPAIGMTGGPPKDSALSAVSSKSTSKDTNGSVDATADQQTKMKSKSSAPSDSVFASFKAAYPEYTGDIKHFQGQCLQINTLDLKDRMVPKWQWDDYIIRSRTDYKTYALDCMDRGEDAMEYNRFYKDHIRDTIYRKDVIADRQTLLLALEQLNVDLPPIVVDEEPIPARQDPFVVQKKSRRSLPSAFNNHKQHLESPIAPSEPKRPRTSLPVATPAPQQMTTHTPILTHTRPTAKLSSTSKLTESLKRIARATPSTSSTSSRESSDPFRDFYFAYQRTTSLTGSTEVDPKKAWPKNLAVRPSIADVPKGKIDALKWKDVL